MYTNIAMSRSLQTLLLALLISSAAASIVNPEVIHSLHFPTPICQFHTVPTNGPAWNFPSYCSCEGNSFYPAMTPAPTASSQTSPMGYQSSTMSNQTSPTADPRCKYAVTDLLALSTIAPTPFTCNLESATTGFTVPNSWCGCTAGESTSTFSTKFELYPTGTIRATACSFMQDELPAGTISPSAATCTVATAMPGGIFYNELAWCACGDNAPHPLITGPSVSGSALCDYTTVPSSTITPTPIAATTCSLFPWYTNPAHPYCGCEGAGTTVRYPTQTAESQPCVFSSVPTQTASVPSRVGSNCYFTGCNPGYTCDIDGQTIVSSCCPETLPRCQAHYSC